MPTTEIWQGIKISGNPILNTWVTELKVKYATDDGAEKAFEDVKFKKTDSLDKPLNATSVQTFWFDDESKEKAMKHIRLIPTKWVGERPCLRFEAFYY